MVCHCHSPLESLNLHDLLCDFFFGFWYLPNKSQTFSGRVRTHSFAFIASLPDESKDYLLKLKMIRNLPAGVLVIRLPWFEDMFYIMHTNIDNYINYIYICFHISFTVDVFIQDLKYKRQRRQFSTSMMVFKRECQGSGCLDLHFTLVRKYRDGIDG